MKAVLILALLFAINSVPIFKAVQAKDEDFMSSIDDGPLEVLPSCSWYCGGFVSEFKSSSTLPNHNGIVYAPNRAHDFDVTTAWVEGKNDYGIGEYIEYEFDMTTLKGGHRLGVNQIILANGYKKSRRSWEENSRVKKLKMYVDDKPYCLIELLDSYEFQTVVIVQIMLPQQKVMKMKFEIMEVFPGTKYKDTAISELLFDGVGVH